jgi:hypothetical protein
MAAIAVALSDNGAFSASPGEPRDWARLLRQAGQSSLEQSWHYGEAVAALHGAPVTRRIIQYGDKPVALVQGFRTRQIKFGSINRILRGPVWLEALSEADRLEVGRLIRQEFSPRRTDLLFWLPELPNTPESTRFMRALGMRRMVTGYSTVWLDIRPDEDRLLRGLHGKWRNSLRAGEKEGLRVRAADRNQAFESSMDAYDRFRRKRRFIGPPANLISHIHGLPSAFGKTGNVRVWEALHDKQPVAGIAVISHGASATYMAGWTSVEGRHGNAHNLLLWRAITELRKAGAHWLDLGGLDTQSAPGIARFKLGLGGDLQTLTGTYL